MKEISSIKPEPEKFSEVVKQEIQKIKQYKGSINMKRGHTLFEINLDEGTIDKAEFERITVYNPKTQIKSGGFGVMKNKFNGLKRVVLEPLESNRRKVMRKKGCIYIPALNKKNAIKKLLKLASKQK